MPIRTRLSIALLVLSACGGSVDSGQADSGVPHDAGANHPAADAGQAANDAGTVLDAGSLADAGVLDAGTVNDGGLPDPVLFIHGINGSAADWATMISRFKALGYPAERLMARTFSDPKYGCNTDNAATIQMWANELMATTHTTRIDLVAHSMGTLSSRRFLKDLGGTAQVNTFVSLGGMNHGLTGLVCLGATNPVPYPPSCTFKEICATQPFIAALNAPPATPGPTVWVTIAGSADTTVPNDSTFLIGAENIVVQGVTHAGAMGLQESQTVTDDVVRVLGYAGH